ncbi:MAG: hypothetical protein J5I92_01990 [Thiogranum sp.]|nr:hypothetical protein [Thiogranum sp.]
MQLPFTTEQFFGVFRLCNTAVWPAQVVLTLLAVLALVFIALRRPWSSPATSAILAVHWVWMGVAYHLAYFVVINPLAYGFAVLSIAGGFMFAWQGVVRRRLDFAFSKSLGAAIGISLLAFALVGYPVWVTQAGHPYPELPTFGLPCPTTIYTIGVLALASGAGIRAVLAVPILWCLAGSQAAFLLDVRPDLGLVFAGIVGLVLCVRAARGGTARPAAAGN